MNRMILWHFQKACGLPSWISHRFFIAEIVNFTLWVKHCVIWHAQHAYTSKYVLWNNKKSLFSKPPVEIVTTLRQWINNLFMCFIYVHRLQYANIDSILVTDTLSIIAVKTWLMLNLFFIHRSGLIATRRNI